MFCRCRVHVHGLRLIKDALNCWCHLLLRLSGGTKPHWWWWRPGCPAPHRWSVFGRPPRGSGTWPPPPAPPVSYAGYELNPGGMLSASVGCRASNCPDRSWSLPAAPAHDGVVKLRSEVSWTPSLRYVSHRNSMAASSRFCVSGMGPGSDQKHFSLRRSKIETSLGPGCWCGNGSPRNLEMFPEAGVEYGPYLRNHRVGGQTPSPIHDLTRFSLLPRQSRTARVHRGTPMPFGP